MSPKGHDGHGAAESSPAAAALDGLSPAVAAVAATGMFSAAELEAFKQAIAGSPNVALEAGSGALPVAPEPQAAVPQVYVNAKQYHCIMRRRAKRAAAAAKNQQLLQRKPFLHESRHQHAQKRLRGPSGRFLTKAELAAMAAAEQGERPAANDEGHVAGAASNAVSPTAAVAAAAAERSGNAQSDCRTGSNAAVPVENKSGIAASPTGEGGASTAAGQAVVTSQAGQSGVSSEGHAIAANGAGVKQEGLKPAPNLSAVKVERPAGAGNDKVVKLERSACAIANHRNPKTDYAAATAYGEMAAGSQTKSEDHIAKIGLELRKGGSSVKAQLPVLLNHPSK